DRVGRSSSSGASMPPMGEAGSESGWRLGDNITQLAPADPPIPRRTNGEAGSAPGGLATSRSTEHSLGRPYMAVLSLKNAYDGRAVVLPYEGPGRLLLNGNRPHDERARRNAAAHPGTVCWIELESGGGRMAQGVGPAAGHLDPAEVDRLLGELPQTS